MNRITALMVGTALVSSLPIATSQSVHAGGAVTAFTVATTVMIDDGTDTCSTSTHAVSLTGSATVRYCVTLTNTGSEALSLHDVQGDSIGQLVGPADATVVEPGSSWSVTQTALETEPHFEQVEWAATGVDSGVEVIEQASASVYIQLQGAFEVQLDMTAMVDDGTDTCGTETDLVVPAGTPVRFCYTMTNTRAVAVAVTFLFDEHVGLVPGAADSGGVPLPELEPGESRVVTNVAVVDESGTWTGHWAGIEDVSESIVQGTDGVAIEVVESPTTTTAPCVATTLPPPTDAPTTQLPTTTTDHDLVAPYDDDHDDAAVRRSDHDDDEPGLRGADDHHDARRAGGVRPSGPGCGALPGDAARRGDAAGDGIARICAVGAGARARRIRPARAVHGPMAPLVNARRVPLLAWVAVSAIAVTGSSSSGVAHAAAMALELTVGEFEGLSSCTGTDTSLTAPVGTPIEYCYVMSNVGDHTLSMHDLDNDVFGPILGDVAIDLEPGESIVSSHVEPLAGTHTSTATWTATVVQHDTETSASDSVTVTALPVDPDLDVAAESAAMSVAMTVMVDDGTDTCGTDTAAVVEKGTVLRFCYTMTNTGDEALNLHDVRDSHIGQIVGPGHDHLVQPGDGVVLTATGAWQTSRRSTTSSGKRPASNRTPSCTTGTASSSRCSGRRSRST